MKILKTSILLTITLYALNGYSACYNNGCDSKVKRLYATGRSDGSVYIEMEDAAMGVVDCTLPEDRFFTLKQDHMLFREIYSMLLASLMSQKDVRVRIREGTADCEVMYSWVWSSL